MNTYSFRYFKGIVRRWYRKKFHKDWDVIEHGIDFFQEFADIYGDTINDINTAERFFKDFLEQTKGWVIVDFLDACNWDCIKKIEVDSINKLIWFYWQIPSGNPVEEKMRQIVFPLGYYGMCLKFDNVRFVTGKRQRCIGIIVNGYTIREKNIKGFAKKGGWDIKGINASSSFFSTSLVREKDGVYQHWRFMNTPILSFWIIPKHLDIHPQDSEKLLYMFGVEKCERELMSALNGIKSVYGLSKEEQRKEIKAAAHEMRIIAESLFKLIICFYQEEYQYRVNNYDDLKLGDLTGPLKKTIYKSELEQKQIDEIPRLANDLSHDSGNPVELKDLYTLFDDITSFISDFKYRIKQKGHNIITIPNNTASPHDFVKARYKSFCFIDEINEVVSKDVGKISYKITTQVGTFVNIFSERDEVLCRDGYIRSSKDEGVEVLMIWDRNEVITLLNKMYQKVIYECKINGYDVETWSLGISFEAILKREVTPTHLFTEKEVEELIRIADDEQHNKLVIDEDGYAHIIQDPKHGYLYPVSQETWCPGNMYVGKDSNLADLHDSYVLCMNLWLAYLQTGNRMYDDLYVSDDGMENVLTAVKKYYSDVRL